MRTTGLVLVLAGACGEQGKSPADAAPDAAVPLRRGVITVSEGGSPGSENTTFAAIFRELTNATVTRRDEGRCGVEHVTFEATVDMSAGVLTFTDEDGSAAVVLSPDRENRYPSVDVEGLRYGVIELLTATADGADIPGFSSTFGFPDHLHVTAPVLEAGQPFSFGPAGFTATWDPTGGAVFLRLTQVLPNAFTTIACPFVGSEERGNIPAAIRADLAPDANGSATSLSVETFNGTRPVVGGFDIAIDSGFVGLSTRVVVP